MVGKECDVWDVTLVTRRGGIGVERSCNMKCGKRVGSRVCVGLFMITVGSMEGPS